MAENAITVVEEHPNLIVVRILPDRLDEASFKAVRADVSTAGDRSPHMALALDMGNVGFMPSLSVGGLIQLSQLFKARDQRLILVNLKPQVREVLAITRVDKLFDIRDDLAALIATPF